MNAGPRYFSLLMCVLATSASWAGSLQREVASLPDIAAPPAGTVMWIARAMRLNGVPMTLKSFSSSMNAAEVIHHYDRYLRRRSDSQSRASYEGKSQVLAVLASDHYVTIRAHNTPGGSEGTIAVSPVLANLLPNKRTSFPLSATMRVVSLQEYDDEGIEAEHISVISKRAPASEARTLASTLVNRGWELVRNHANARRDGYVIEAQKAAALAQIHLQRPAGSADTMIMIVWRKS